MSYTLVRPSAEAVTAQCDRILASRPFALAQRSREVLRYIVERSLLDTPPKEYEIAVDVLKRGPGYDPAVDATVRVEASRLRSRLRDYYATDGIQDPILIEIPRGAYAASFTLREAVSPATAPVAIPAAPSSDPAQPAPARARRRWLLLTIVVLVILTAAWVVLRKLYAVAPIHSIAVLPLNNLSGDPSQEYFADGMTEELITELAQIPTLRVVSRTSVMQDKGARKPLSQIARELHVDAIIEGSVVRSGDRVRITAQLIDVRDDRHLWAKSFEEPISDLLTWQDTVAREVASQARVALAPGPSVAASRINPSAYDAYLHGLFFLHIREASRSAEYFRQAIGIDPAYASAYAGLAQALVSMNLVDGAQQSVVMPPALAAAEHAIHLDPSSGEAYISRGNIEIVYNQAWDSARRDLERGTALSPSYSLGEMQYATWFDAVGRPEEAVAHMRHALQLDPLSFFMNRHLGSTLYFARHYDEALEYLHRALAMEPTKSGVVQGWISRCYELSGRIPEAYEADLLSFKDYPGLDLAPLRSAYKAGGWPAYQAARAAALQENSTGGCQDYEVAVSYLRLGDRDRAFPRLTRAAADHCFWAFTLKIDPLLDTIRTDPRYPALLHQVNLQP